MRAWTIGVLFVCWSGLSAVAWWLFRPAVLDWAAYLAAEQSDSNQVELIANALPFITSALVILMVFLVTRRASRSVMTERFAVPEPAALGPTTASAPASRTENAPSSRAITRRLYIKPAGSLVHSGARFGVVVPSNGTNVRDAGARSEQEIYFTKLDDHGTLMAQIPCDHLPKRRLRCFVDYKGLKYERVRHALAASRFIMVTPRANRHFRAWFLLPDTKMGRLR